KESRDAVAESILAIQRDAKQRIKNWPAVDTGRYRASVNINFVPDKLIGEVGDVEDTPQANHSGKGTHMAEYAKHIEFGTKYMKARPSLYPAYFKEIPVFRRRIKSILQRRRL
ncbi:MAG: hypothetical protein DRH26_01745, partial [Deltaproteobacteria bacterium]